MEKWNGKIKEYDSNKLIFEGEYKDGKKWNGIFYFPENNSISGKIFHGNGSRIKEYNYLNLLIFQGEYKKMVKNGKDY